jgi:sigma-B regulation protein RsbU (phosphoserine phosphatase)
LAEIKNVVSATGLQSITMTTDAAPATLLGNFKGTSEEQLAYIVATMREMSLQTDPQKMVQQYGARVRHLMNTDRFISLSRRDLKKPQVRITRNSLSNENINPWLQPERLPVLDGGLLSDLIWGDQPAIIDDLQLDPADPGYSLLNGIGSLAAIPLYDHGTSLNMVVLCRSATNGFNHDLLPEHVWMSNLFGRATHNLLLSQQLREAYDAVDREMKVVAEIQQSLLPTELPQIPTLDLAVHYQTSKRAGGDYYDFFPLPDNRWGILVADVSGHGTPAAVIMAVTHSIAHTHHGEPQPPSRLLAFVNDHLTARYTAGTGTFVTAFYGIYDCDHRTLTYASAGHCPPRIRRANNGILESMDQSRQLPLGIEKNETYKDITEHLKPGDAIMIYTDGLTEARSPKGGFYGLEMLDEVLLKCKNCTAQQLLDDALRSVEAFTQDTSVTDDRTLLAVTVR